MRVAAAAIERTAHAEAVPRAAEPTAAARAVPLPAAMNPSMPSEPRRAAQDQGMKARILGMAPVSSPVMRPWARPPTLKNATSVPTAPTPMAALRPKRSESTRAST